MNGEGWREGGKEEEKGEGGGGGGRERRGEVEGGKEEEEKEGEQKEEEYSDTMIDSMDMCFHKLSSEGENHFKQCLKDRDVSCKEAISNETPYLMERLWLPMGMLIDR